MYERQYGPKIKLTFNKDSLTRGLAKWVQHLFMYVVALFFNLVKAYDTTWHHRIMTYLFQLAFPNDLGVPQGSKLGVTLFGIKVNGIVAAFKKGGSHRRLVLKYRGTGILV